MLTKKTQRPILITLAVITTIVIIAFVYNIVMLISTSVQVGKLESDIAYLDSLISANSDEIAYRDTEEYIRKYAQEYLNMKGNGDLVFVGK